MPNILPKSRPETSMRTRDTASAGRNPYLYNTKTVTMFASPSFTPGTGKCTGIRYSTYPIITAREVSIPRYAVFLAVVISICHRVYHTGNIDDILAFKIEFNKLWTTRSP